MFPTTIPDLTDGTTDHDYDTLYTDGRKSVRKDVASTQDEPSYFEIAHNETGSGESLTQNSKAGFKRTVTDAEGNVGVIDVYIVIRNPLKVATAAQVLEVTNQMADFLATSTYAAQLINGEI